MVAGVAAIAADPPAASDGRMRSDPPPAGQERGQRREEGRPNQNQGDRHLPPRLTPEEKKALRQQIHEAGHDIYHPKGQ